MSALGPMTAMRNEIGLSVVVPAHNSSAVIEACVAQLRARLAVRSAEIIVVENGSTDDTFERCTRLAKDWTDPNVQLVILRSDKGMGNALRTGALASRGSCVLLTADDLPFGFDDIDAADRYAAEHGGRYPKVLIGSKAHPESIVNRGPLRGGLTWGFGQLRRWMLGMRTGDPQGTILVEGALLRRLADMVVEPGFLFTTELICLLERLSIRPLEVPVRLRPDHDQHASRVSKSDVVAMGAGLLRVRKRHLGVKRTPEPLSLETISQPRMHVRQGEPRRAPSMSRADVIRLAAGVAVSAFFLAAALRATSVEMVWRSLVRLSLPVVCVTLAMCLLEITVRAARWRWLLQPYVSVSVGSSFLYICVGHFANTLLPFRLGDAARAHLAGSHFKVSRMTVLGTIVIERLADGMLLMAVLALGVIIGLGSTSPWSGSLPVLAGLGVVGGSILFVARRRITRFMGAKAPRLESALRHFEIAFGAMASRRMSARVVATTAASFGLSVLILHMALSAAGIDLDWRSTAIAISAMTLSTALPAAPGALGTYEFAGTAVLTAVGVPPSSALTAVVVVHVLATIPPAIIGLVATLGFHFDVLSVRSKRREPEPLQPTLASSGTVGS